MEILQQSITQAITEEKCHLCYGVLKKKEKYHCTWIQNEGEHSFLRAHLHCLELVSLLEMPYKGHKDQSVGEKSSAGWVNAYVKSLDIPDLSYMDIPGSAKFAFERLKKEKKEKEKK
ncbi:hypothetical protein KAR91_10660 [Candidatus Pacearchaeota archaeon]|nr:hypothetical protein [Candidatus Pacearchaeota archaeon]